MNPPLDRFVIAQEAVYDRALSELRAGCKETQWMWFVFPQIAGLGRSETARIYAIAGIEEARAFLRHPILGQRLEEAVATINALPGRNAAAVFGGIDVVKLRSSLTLFREAGGGPVFDEALEKYFDGSPDPKTLRLLHAQRAG